jgi:hypothetical protein
MAGGIESSIPSIPEKPIPQKQNANGHAINVSGLLMERGIIFYTEVYSPKKQPVKDSCN